MFTTPFAFMAAPAGGGGPLLGNMIALDAGNPSSYPGSGSSWFDLSGNGNTVTLFNSPTYSASNGGILSFNGTNQYGQAANSASLGVTGLNFTCEYWIKADVVGNYIPISKAPYAGGPSNQNGNYMLWYYDTAVYFVSDPGNGLYNYVNSSFTQNLNWNSFVYRYNNGVGTFYINNVLQATSGPNGNPLGTTTEPLLIAKRKDNAGILNGKLSVINIWNYALTPTEISDNYDYYSTRY